MENSNEFFENPNTFSLENNSGRPLDLVISHEAPISFERHDFSVVLSNQRVAKKGCNQSAPTNDGSQYEVCTNELNVSMIKVGNGSSFMVIEGGLNLGDTTIVQQQEGPRTVVNGQSKPSFRDIIA
ncbi:hypothetical protein V6N13_032522 [Hibiscus sabdariffa]